MEKGHEIKVLDHGYVRLVDWMGSDSRICEAARISYKSPSKGVEQDKKLLEYLWKNKHTSPFEMVKITLNIKMPIFIMRQYVRHRMQNLNEVSARYTELPNEFYIPKKWRAQDTKNKQGSTAKEDWDKVGFDVPYADKKGSFFLNMSRNEAMEQSLRARCKECYETYELMLACGVAREMARIVLPVNIYTEIYACWDLKNLLHFITLRDDSHAQAEIQEYSRAIREICNELFPITMAAFGKYKWKLEENSGL